MDATATLGIVVRAKDEASAQLAKLEGAAGSAGGMFSKLGKLVAVAGAAVAAGIGAITAWAAASISKTIAAGNAAYEMAEKFGMSAHSASQWISVGSQLGISQDQISAGFRYLSKQIQSANVDMEAGTKGAKAFAKTGLGQLGLSMAETKAHSNDMTWVMDQVANRFKSMPDGAAKAALALQIFGRAGQQLIPVLNQGAAGIAAYMANGQKMGDVMSNTQVAQARAAYLAQQQLDTAIKGVTTSMGVLLIPMFTTLLNMITKYVIPALGQLAGWIGPHLQPIIAFFAKLLGDVGAMLQAHVTPTLNTMGVIINTIVIPAFQKVWGFITSYVVPLFTNLLIPAFQKLVTFVVGTLVPLFVNTFIPVFQKLVSFILSNLVPIIINSVIPAFQKVSTFIMGTLIPAIGQLVSWFLVNVVPTLGKFVAFIVGQVVPKLVSIGVTIAGQVLPMLTEFFQWLWKYVIDPLLHAAQVVIPIFLGALQFVASHFSTIASVVAPLALAVGALWATEKIISWGKIAIQTIEAVVAKSTLLQGLGIGSGGGAGGLGGADLGVSKVWIVGADPGVLGALGAASGGGADLGSLESGALAGAAGKAGEAGLARASGVPLIDTIGSVVTKLGLAAIALVAVGTVANGIVTGLFAKNPNNGKGFQYQGFNAQQLEGQLGAGSQAPSNGFFGSFNIFANQEVNNQNLLKAQQSIQKIASSLDMSVPQYIAMQNASATMAAVSSTSGPQYEQQMYNMLGFITQMTGDSGKAVDAVSALRTVIQDIGPLTSAQMQVFYADIKGGVTQAWQIEMSLETAASTLSGIPASATSIASGLANLHKTIPKSFKLPGGGVGFYGNLGAEGLIVHGATHAILGEGGGGETEWAIPEHKAQGLGGLLTALVQGRPVRGFANGGIVNPGGGGSWGGGGDVTIVLELDGRELARSTIRHLGPIMKRTGYSMGNNA